MVRHRLSNVVLKIADHMTEYPEVFFRTQSALEYDTDKNTLTFSGKVDFLTYFNACSIQKWRKYAQVEAIWLHIETSGDPCLLRFVAVSHDDGTVEPLGDIVRLNRDNCAYACEEGPDGRLSFDIKMPSCNKDLASFVLESEGETALHRAYYFTEVEEAAINPVRLALSTTTFKKEDYIIPNIDLVKREVLGSDDPVAQAFHMFVVDNGCTLDAQGLSDEGVTVLPNPNVGGAGGFARGMMEALAAEEGYTHVLLMDDDVIVSPESLKRTYNLLALVQDKYKDAFINGAMLAVEEPNKQYEDVARVSRTGVYYRVKEDLYVDQVQDIAENESIELELPRAYGAWWYSCIPLDVVRKKGLPLPVFVRCDDVEYGMRTDPTYMTMNGICVWHEGFEGRFRASVDCYQYVRNFLIMVAVDGRASERLFMTRYWRDVRLKLRSMSYDAVELFLDGLEDYLKGPEYLAHVSGEELMKTNGAKNEKLVPVEELDQSIMSSLKFNPRILNDEPHLSIFIRLWRTLPYDRHYMPDAFLRDKPEAVPYTGFTTTAIRAIGTKTLVALDPSAKHGCIRRMDKRRWRELKQRCVRLKREYRDRGAEVRAAYKAAMPYLTSWEFWNDYLGTDLKPRD